MLSCTLILFFFFQAEDGIRDLTVTGVQTCALPIFDRYAVELALPSWVTTITGDVEEIEPASLVTQFGGRFDVVLSDMAPNTTGHPVVDQARSETLTARALFMAKGVLRPGGHFAAKVFQGRGFQELLVELRKAFGEVKSVQVEATRTGSTEQYLVGRGLKARAAVGLPSRAP